MGGGGQQREESEDGHLSEQVLCLAGGGGPWLLCRVSGTVAGAVRLLASQKASRIASFLGK